jgi:hypothetical protein
MNIAEVLEVFDRPIPRTRNEVLAEFDDPKIVDEDLWYIVIEVQPKVFMLFYFEYDGMSSYEGPQAIFFEQLRNPNKLYFQRMYCHVRSETVVLFDRRSKVLAEKGKKQIAKRSVR